MNQAAVLALQGVLAQAISLGMELARRPQDALLWDSESQPLVRSLDALQKSTDQMLRAFPDLGVTAEHVFPIHLEMMRNAQRRASV